MMQPLPSPLQCVSIYQLIQDFERFFAIMIRKRRKDLVYIEVSELYFQMKSSKKFDLKLIARSRRSQMGKFDRARYQCSKSQIF